MNKPYQLWYKEAGMTLWAKYGGRYATVESCRKTAEFAGKMLPLAKFKITNSYLPTKTEIVWGNS